MLLIFKVTFFMLATLHCVGFVNGVYVYSSFWAPLFNPRILNYRVDSKFNPEAGKNEKTTFENNYGYRGVNLIEDLGNGKGPSSLQNKDQNYGDVKFYYTYPGANMNEELFRN